MLECVHKLYVSMLEQWYRTFDNMAALVDLGSER